jgi:spermidine synthase
MTTRQNQRFLFLIFALSGSTGLIYESVWSHYLKLFLGHAAYAQCLVLIIFMGGMALGAWGVSRFGANIKNMLLSYALVEGVIGIFGLVFHSLFQLMYSYSFESIIPILGTPLYVHLYKFLIASLIILPQSILLGATFPLMSGGFLRKFPDTPGKTISVLYFSNSIGAAFAVLLSSFYLIAKLGLPGTIFTAGLINIFIALLVYSLAKEPANYPATTIAKPNNQNWQWLILGAAFFTGMASFIYEVAWIRMLSMVLGASTHSFELMLSAFITGLAIGGFWIRKKIDTLGNPVMFAAMVQIIMGLFALSTIIFYNYSFHIVSFFMAALKQSEQGYLLYNLTSHSIALLIMLPTTICAGMTLPLFTFILLKQGFGEKSIGQIYSSNTIGAITGVIFTIFIGMPLINLKGSILTGAILDILIGIILLKTCTPIFKYKYTAIATALVSSLVLIIALSTEFNTRRMASGVFRHGVLDQNSNSDILFHKDGKTATVSVTNWNNETYSISTNGKPDAQITVAPGSPPSKDEATMTLLAALPLSTHPNAKNIANIGLGSGLTAHVALASQNINRIDTIEIEEAIATGAKHFGSKTEKIFNDPRSHIYLDDAKTFFSTQQNKYDIIISEPSNPWVSGVSSLFTQEFYKITRSNLNTNGIFVQWIHIYEFNLELLVSVLKAISSEFPYYSIYFADDGDLVLIASVDKQIPLPDESIFTSPEMAQHLSTIYVKNIEDLRFRFLGDHTIFTPYINHFSIPINSDYYPYLDQNAVKARYLKQSVTQLLRLRISNIPILDLLYDDNPYRTVNLSPTEFYPSQDAVNAYNIYDYFNKKVFDRDNIIAIAGLNFLLSAAGNCNSEYNKTVWIDSLFIILSRTVSYLTRDQIDEIISAISSQCDPTIPENSHLNWISLFISINTRNHSDILSTSINLLSNENYNTLEQKKYLLTTLLIGLIKSGQFQQASDLWRDDMADLFIVGGEIPLEYQVLLALVKTPDK